MRTDKRSLPNWKGTTDAHLCSGGDCPLSPFRIGGWLSHDDAANQTRTVRDPAEEDRPFVPSTGLVGSLRAHADDKAEELFGPPRGGELKASLVGFGSAAVG